MNKNLILVAGLGIIFVAAGLVYSASNQKQDSMEVMKKGDSLMATSSSDAMIEDDMSSSTENDMMKKDSMMSQ